MSESFSARFASGVLIQCGTRADQDKTGAANSRRHVTMPVSLPMHMSDTRRAAALPRTGASVTMARLGLAAVGIKASMSLAIWTSAGPQQNHPCALFDQSRG